MPDLTLGPHTTFLVGEANGSYPHGNSLLVRGRDASVVIDPSLSLVGRGRPQGIDQVILSHCHEDHIAGVHLFPDRPVAVHEADKLGLDTIDGLMAIYGLDEEASAHWRDEVVREFHYVSRPDALAYTGANVWDLGGATVRAIHLPGHTRGHCGLLVEPDGVLYLADIDLTGFGPYYGDAWSDLDEFEASLEQCRDIDARWFATFHHKGAIEGRDAFLPMLESFASVIPRRDHAMLEFLAEPRTIDDMVRHRFVYRPHVELTFVDSVERHTAERHIARFVKRGQVVEVDAGRFRAA